MSQQHPIRIYIIFILLISKEVQINGSWILGPHSFFRWKKKMNKERTESIRNRYQQVTYIITESCGKFMSHFLKFVYLFIYLFIYFQLCWVFIATHGLTLVVANRATLCCSARASRCSGFSYCRAWALGTRASVVAACRLSSCGTRAQLRHGMWDLPGPGIEPVSPALAGGLLTTAPPGKSLMRHF